MPVPNLEGEGRTYKDASGFTGEETIGRITCSDYERSLVALQATKVFEVVSALRRGTPRCGENVLGLSAAASDNGRHG